jgi:hypothetical protein
VEIKYDNIEMTEQLYSRLFNVGSNTGGRINSPANSSGLWSLPNFIQRDDGVTRIEFRVIHAEIPVSFYIINKNNNILQVNGINYFIPLGNYNIKTFTSYLATIGITASFSVLTSKYTFLYSNNFTISGSKSTCRNIIGLGKSEYSSVNNTLEMPNVVNFLPLARINFRSSALQLDNFNSYDKSNDIFISLQNSSSQNAMINYKNSAHVKYILEIDNLTTLDIRITDDMNQLIDFNGLDWYLTICIDTYYISQNDTQNSFSKIVKSNNLNLYSTL